MTRLTKKAIACALAILLVVSSLPFTAFASDELDRLNTAIEAYEAAMDGTVYTNMQAAYDAYYQAVKARDVSTYGTRTDLDLDTLAQNLETTTAAMSEYNASFTTVDPSFHGDDLTAYEGTAYNNLLYSPQVGTASDSGYTATVENTNAKVKYELYYAQTVMAYDGTNQLRMPVMVCAKITESKTRYIYGCYPMASASDFANHPYLALTGFWYDGDNVYGWDDKNKDKDGNWSFAAQLAANVRSFGYNNETGYASNQTVDHRSQELPQYGTMFWWQGRSYFAANIMDVNYTFAEGEYLKTFQPNWYICASESPNSVNDTTTMKGNNVIYVINYKAFTDAVFSSDYTNVLASVTDYNKDNSDMSAFLAEYDKATAFSINDYDYSDTEAKATACAEKIETLVNNLSLANNAVDVSNTTDYYKLFNAIEDYRDVYKAGNVGDKYPAETWNKFVTAYESAIEAVNNIPENGYVDDFGEKPVATIAETLDFLLDKEGTCGTDNEYVYDSTTGVVTITGTGTMENYGETGDSPFAGNTKITKVVIEEGVTSIGDYTFYNCTNLEEVTIPATVTSVGVSAFENCSGLETIAVPAGAVYQDDAFTGCDSLESVTITSGDIVSKAEDDYNAPWYQPTVKTLEITNGVTLIGENAFNGATNIVKLIVPCDIPINTTTNTNAFRGMESLKYITITKGKTGVMIDWTGYYTKSPWYGNNTNARLEITVESGVKNIGANAFRDCNHVFVMDLPATVASIGEHAFYGCTALDDIYIYDSNCNIADFASTFDSITKIHGYEYSTAQSYATKYNRDFIPFGAHTHNWQESEVVAPTCEGMGYTIYTCSGCNDIKYANYENALGHDYQKTSQVVAPTCVSQGYTVYKCSRCQSTDNQDFTNSLGHDCHASEVVAPTCIDDGYTVYKCSRCEYEYSDDFIDAGDAYHSYNTNTVGPTCTDKGYTEYECEYCHNKFKDDYVNELGHDWQLSSAVGATCQHGGYTEYECSRCHVTEKRNVTDAIDHNYIENGDILRATFTTEGNIPVKCDRCGDTTNRRIICPTAKLKKSSYVYIGKVYKPAVTVTDGDGNTIDPSNYTLTYAKGRKTVGKYWVKVKFNSDCKYYSGSKTIYFRIVPKSTTVSKLTSGNKSMTVTWKKQAVQTTGYQIQIATNSKFTKNAEIITVSKNTKVKTVIKKLKENKTYYVRIRTYKTVKKVRYVSAWSKSKKIKIKPYVKKVTINKPVAGKKSITVKWKKLAGVTGYQIQYSTSKKMKKATKVKVKGAKKTSKKVSKLKAKKTYYVRVRAYRTVSGKTYYGKWSATKNIKTK